jgi:hypothetical protein
VIDELTTVLITTSPRPVHPLTDQIEYTVLSVRRHLPTAEIVILCDGIRPEQENRKEAYSDFVLRLEALCLEKWRNVRLVVFPTWQHQAQCIAKGIEQVKTPLTLFTEDDQVLIADWIPWTDMAAMLASDNVRLIRFMLEDFIKPEWQQFMLGPVMLNGCDTMLTKTVQWSQRTHLAWTNYYRVLIAKHLKPGDRCYLEDRLYGQCDEWEENRLSIFTPPNPRRIWHSDGRMGEVKYDSVLEGKE